MKIIFIFNKCGYIYFSCLTDLFGNCYCSCQLFQDLVYYYILILCMFGQLIYREFEEINVVNKEKVLKISNNYLNIQHINLNNEIKYKCTIVYKQ